jgi:hypothetical protein
LEPICYSDDAPADVANDVALLNELTLQVQFAGLSSLDLLSKIVVGLLKISTHPEHCESL